MMIAALIVLGLFGVYVLNNNLDKPKSAEESLLKLPASPSPALSQVQTKTQTQTLNVTPSVTSAPSSQAEVTTATIKTNKGDITISFYPKDAPKTVANFVSKAKSGFYANKIFHRVEDWVIQGGDPDGNGTGGGNKPVEFNSKPFVTGTIGMASRGDGQVENDSQFFIVKTDAQFLNGQYTNFGIVTKGMDVVNKIEIGDKILGIQTR